MAGRCSRNAHAGVEKIRHVKGVLPTVFGHHPSWLGILPKRLPSDTNGQQIAGHCAIGGIREHLSAALRNSAERLCED